MYHKNLKKTATPTTQDCVFWFWRNHWTVLNVSQEGHFQTEVYIYLTWLDFCVGAQNSQVKKRPCSTLRLKLVHITSKKEMQTARLCVCEMHTWSREGEKENKPGRTEDNSNHKINYWLLVLMKGCNSSEQSAMPCTIPDRYLNLSPSQRLEKVKVHRANKQCGWWTCSLAVFINW